MKRRFDNWLRLMALGLALLPSHARAENWLLIEARDIPAQCRKPLECIDQSTLAQRTMLYIPRQERRTLLLTLNRLSAIRGIPSEGPKQTVVAQQDMIAILHPLPKSQKLDTLINHPGVFFDSTKLDADIQTTEFSSVVRRELGNVGVRFLTEDEWQATPGRPTLSVRLTPRSESEGCIIPFSVSLSISEEAVMVRNPSLKVTGSTWSGMAKQNLANNNYTPLSALREVVATLASDWQSQNP